MQRLEQKEQKLSNILKTKNIAKDHSNNKTKEQKTKKLLCNL